MESSWVSYTEAVLGLSRNVSSIVRWQKGESEQSLSTDTPGKHRMTWNFRGAEASEESEWKERKEKSGGRWRKESEENHNRLYH